jgi:hypothetical protein
MTRMFRRALAGAIGVFALIPALAAAAPGSMDLPRTAQYGDLKISTNLAVSMGLGCNLIGTELTCYRTQAEALAAGDAAVAANNLAAGSETATGGAVITATCSPPMSLYDGTSFTGSFVNLYTQSLWLNLSGIGFDNRTSSWTTGCAGGYLANGTGGSGATIGMPAYNSQSSLGSFNNLASSAKRCPC